ncbi:hypothetical protein [Mesorhizobium montanum]|uniref:hypothetical protein n=1 Tax=Mesorhizobium montanum TaxID=3072323 RepID=UPI002A249E5C|nr:hypothetical protein [Mesorhizobium sp. MSK_1335]
MFLLADHQKTAANRNAAAARNTITGTGPFLRGCRPGGGPAWMSQRCSVFARSMASGLSFAPEPLSRSAVPKGLGNEKRPD